MNNWLMCSYRILHFNELSDVSLGLRNEVQKTLRYAENHGRLFECLQKECDGNPGATVTADGGDGWLRTPGETVHVSLSEREQL